ncbi:ABC transporter permease [Paenibacillus pinihumi]|uniref:ABC transporter permease n=1 Tax=Paenibacillus pinihumi TaxID=669462 RepID=UPI00048BD36E|nr:ABC transporter permease [Paenibacillus pinihumi]
MQFSQGVRMAWKSIIANKLRTLLTMLGIVIGVASVITLVAMGNGTRQQVKEQMAGLGTNLLSVNISGRGAVSSLTVEEAEQLGKLDGVKDVSPVISGNVQAKYKTKNVNVTVEGITPSYEGVRNVHIQRGRYITGIDVAYRQKVALIGTGTAGELFGTADPVGAAISLNGNHYKIVGLLEQQGTSLGGSNDDKIMVPISAGSRLLQTKGVRSVYLQAEDDANMDSIELALEGELTRKFRGNTSGYNIFNQADLVETISSVSATLSNTLAGIASISLLVGGIGIMNIMLVSVTERTREIGIRKSIGARRRDILLQFLLEALVISGLSGIVGVLVSYGAAYFLTRSGTLAVMTWDTIALSFIFSFAIGITFGIFPANKASRLRPVDALRYD